MTSEEEMTRFDFYRMAKSHEAKGEYEKALEAFAKAIDIADDYAHAWYYKGQLHYKLGQYQDAIKCAKRAVELEPSWQTQIIRMLRDAEQKLT
jgi:tetratricopeptide (TPR) repeat protein